MKHLRLLLCAVLLALPFAVYAHAQDAPTVQCRALDALGNPIPKAVVQSFVLSNGTADGATADFALTNTDAEGNFAMPQPSGNTVVRLLHPDYGTAETGLSNVRVATRVQDNFYIYRFSLVKKGSEAEKNALRGSVVDPDNHAIAGARVMLWNVRTPDGINIRIPSNGQSVYTDKTGGFSIYPVQVLGREAPVLPNAIYSIAAVQPSHSFFPHNGSYKNSEVATIRLDRPELAHHFVFMGPDGQPLSAQELSRHGVSLSFRDKNGISMLLPQRFNTGPVKLMPGRYEALYVDAQRAIKYPAVEVTKDSPEELVFHFPPPLPASSPSPATSP